MRNIVYVPAKSPLKTQPVFSKRMATPRSTYRNIRKIQARPGQIVYYTTNSGVRPMRVLHIDDCSRWSSLATYKNRRNYMIYYDLQPLVKTTNGYKPKPYSPVIRTKANMYWSTYNKRIWNSGWIGHAIDMDQFCLTWAEANHARLSW